MADASYDLRTLIIDDYFRTPTLYLALFTVRPAADGTGGTEVAGGSYARQTVDFGPDTDGLSVNLDVITFAGMPACVVVAGGFYTAVSGSTGFRGARNFTVSRTVVAGSPYVIAAGDIVLNVR